MIITTKSQQAAVNSSAYSLIRRKKETVIRADGTQAFFFFLGVAFPKGSTYSPPDMGTR